MELSFIEVVLVCSFWLYFIFEVACAFQSYDPRPKSVRPESFYRTTVRCEKNDTIFCGKRTFDPLLIAKSGFTFYLENFWKIMNYQGLFAIIYLLLPLMSSFNIPFIKYHIAVFTIIAGLLNYISLSNVTFYLLDKKKNAGEQPFFVTPELIFKVLCFFVFCLGRVMMVAGVFIAMPLYFFAMEEAKGPILLHIPIGCLLILFLVRRLLSKHFLFPYFLLERKTFAQAWSLSLEYSQYLRARILSFISALVIPAAGLIIVYRISLRVTGLPVSLERVRWGLFTLLMLYLSYGFVASAIFYRVLTSDYIQDPKNHDSVEEFPYIKEIVN